MIVCFSLPSAYEQPENKNQVLFVFVSPLLKPALAQIGLSVKVIILPCDFLVGQFLVG